MLPELKPGLQRTVVINQIAIYSSSLHKWQFSALHHECAYHGRVHCLLCLMHWMVLRSGPWAVIRTVATPLRFAANGLAEDLLYKPYGTKWRSFLFLFSYFCCTDMFQFYFKIILNEDLFFFKWSVFKGNSTIMFCWKSFYNWNKVFLCRNFRLLLVPRELELFLAIVIHTCESYTLRY